MEEFNLKTDRADVIVPAAEIFLIIAGIVKAEYIHVPVIGLADGIIDNLYAIYGAQNETYIEGWEKKTSNLLIYKRLCKI